jgi:ribosomal protein S18 acetylase RimI-like enzyme
MTILIASATTEDLPHIHRLAHSIWNQHYLGIITQTQIDYMLEKDYNLDHLRNTLASGTQFLIVTDNTKPIGFAGFRLIKAGQVHLDKLYLSLSHQRLGLGQWMLNHIEAQAMTLSAELVTLNVNKHNQKAIKAYHRAGYHHLQSVLETIGAGFYVDDYIYGKVIDAANIKQLLPTFEINVTQT